MMNGWGDGAWSTGDWMMLLFAMVFLVAVGIGIVFLVRGLAAGGTGTGNQAASGRYDSPEEILKRRYAAGEIDREDYESRLRDLRS